MNCMLRPWQLYFLILAGWVNRQQQIVIEYLRATRRDAQVLSSQGSVRIMFHWLKRRLVAWVENRQRGEIARLHQEAMRLKQELERMTG